MTILVGYIKRHQLIVYFVLTYAFSWTLWIPLQKFVLEGEIYLMPFISLGIYAPALVSIGLSAILKPLPRQGSHRPATIAFFVMWILASAIIVMYLILYKQYDLSTIFVIICILTGLIPAFIFSSFFSTNPGVRALFRTYLKPGGKIGYYLLALVLFPGIWLLGNLLSRILGMGAPFSNYQALDLKFVEMVILFFLYNLIYSGLSEEPGWRGFALPRLQTKASPLVSSLILGFFWAVWHAPIRFGGIESKNISDTLVEWILILLVTVIFTWFFNRTKGSILVTALLHPAMNTIGNFLNGTLGAILLLFVFMVFVIVLDKMWWRLPADHPAVYPPEISGKLQNAELF